MNILGVFLGCVVLSVAYDNLALNKPAYQEYPYTGLSLDFTDASNAVDGLKSNLNVWGKQCVVSANARRTATWWVNLINISSIHHITIFFRTENNVWGYYGSNCSDPCPDSHCRYCHLETGACQGCQPGYEGHHCESCLDVNDTCLFECTPGHIGHECKTLCDTGTYGTNCNEICGHCLHSEDCFAVNGTCLTGCASGYFGHRCKTLCHLGTYGAGCNEICGHCFQKDTCLHTNGTCVEGCDPGFSGNLCKTPCENGTYGRDCNKTCGHCRDGSSCLHTNGTCLTGSDSGYFGDLCKRVDTNYVENNPNDSENGRFNSDNEPVVGIYVVIVSLSILLAISVGFNILLCRHKTKSSHFCTQMCFHNDPQNHNVPVFEEMHQYTTLDSVKQESHYQNISNQIG
uniref:Neurogenic locus notch homolog protein 1-like n=1 Tax=Crassostrea virginica TaxID=6565 RepID=A0A8B8BVV7_CRAVI|nr:neurogenic locus notch homolog protein 1-like [Crassostrea virginica]